MIKKKKTLPKKRKKKKETFKRFERALARRFVIEQNKKYPGIYTKPDNDSPDRQFKSGWDLLVTSRERVVFIEFKHEQKPPEDIRTVLRPYQLESALEISARGTSYYTAVFLDGGYEEIALYKDIRYPSAYITVSWLEFMEILAKSLKVSKVTKVVKK